VPSWWRYPRSRSLRAFAIAVRHRWRTWLCYWLVACWSELRISGAFRESQTSYKKFVAEVQASTSRGILQTETTSYLNFSSVPCVSLQKTCCVLTLVMATSVQGDRPWDGKVCGEDYWWLAQSLQHLRYTISLA
jgi:hypothetical protein